MQCLVANPGYRFGGVHPDWRKRPHISERCPPSPAKAGCNHCSLQRSDLFPLAEADRMPIKDQRSAPSVHAMPLAQAPSRISPGFVLPTRVSHGINHREQPPLMYLFFHYLARIVFPLLCLSAAMITRRDLKDEWRTAIDLGRLAVVVLFIISLILVNLAMTGKLRCRCRR